MDCYIRSVAAHPALTSLPYLFYSNIEMLKSFFRFTNEPQLAAEMNDVTYVLVHRDLHLDNVLLDPSPGPLLSLFGRDPSCGMATSLCLGPKLILPDELFHGNDGNHVHDF